MSLPLLLAWGISLVAEAAPQVKLVFPVRDGLEFAKVGRLVNDARVYEDGRQVFVLVGSYDDARVAYRLGSTLQQRLKLPFELHYDPGHPQSDLSWTETVDRPPVTTAAPLRDTQPAQSGAEREMAPTRRAEDARQEQERNQAASPREPDAGPPRSQRVDPPRSEQEQQPSVARDDPIPAAVTAAAVTACASPSLAGGSAGQSSNRSTSAAADALPPCPLDAEKPLTPIPVAAGSVTPP